MGMRGPVPKPTALVLLEGNPGKRKINKGEPQPRRVPPRCPAHLDAFAKQEWRRLVPILQRMRVLSEADFLALSTLCQTYSTLVKAATRLNKEGLIITTKSGYVQQNPVYSIANSCAEMMTRLTREFGLTPASRTRLEVQESELEIGVGQSEQILDF